MHTIEYYHITCNAYKVGEILRLNSSSFYHNSTQNDNRSWIDNFLDSTKPGQASSRKKTFYACDSIANCKSLKSTVAKPGCSPRIYKVRLSNPSKSPMVLVNHLLQLGEGNELNLAVAREYWEPVLDWKFYEYLSDEMEIVEEITNQDLSSMGQILFWASDNSSILSDSKLAKEKF